MSVIANKELALTASERALIEALRSRGGTESALHDCMFDAQVRRGRARSVSVTRRELIALAADPDRLVRHAVISHPNVPKQALTILAGDEWTRIRTRVAKHPRTPKSALLALARDRSIAVRAGAASNPALTPRILNVLLKDDAAQVAYELADSELVSEAQLVALAIRKGGWVVSKALDKPGLSEDALVELARSVGGYPLAWSTVPMRVTNVLLGHSDGSVRRITARDHVLSVERIESLVRQGDEEVLLGLAENPATPAHVKDRIAELLVPYYEREARLRERWRKMHESGTLYSRRRKVKADV